MHTRRETIRPFSCFIDISFEKTRFVILYVSELPNRMDGNDMTEHKLPLVLASGSPRRRELLAFLGVPFSCVVSGADEHVSPCQPEEMVRKLAQIKAECVLDLLETPSVVLGADTVVVLDGEILGKPADAPEAAAMLSRLQGHTHTVVTGICLLNSETGEHMVDYERTEVIFAPMTDEEIADYVATGDPLDKAGAYGIQGPCAVHIPGIHGCYYNVMGLPLHKLYRMLKAFGFANE